MSSAIDVLTRMDIMEHALRLKMMAGSEVCCLLRVCTAFLKFWRDPVLTIKWMPARASCLARSSAPYAYRLGHLPLYTNQLFAEWASDGSGSDMSLYDYSSDTNMPLPGLPLGQ